MGGSIGELEQNQILLAGANGFIGSFLYKNLNKEYALTALNYRTSSIEENFHSLDLTQEEEVVAFAEKSPKCDVLIFLVGLAHKKGKGQELDEFRKINKQTLVNLLSILKEKDKLPGKIIFASTISVYGEKINQNVYNEDSEKNPFSPYAVTKLEAEEYLLDNFSDRSWILRFAPVYSRNLLLNINRRTMIRNIPYRVGNGKNKLSLCNIKNIGLSIESIINGDIPYGIYNLSDKNSYNYNDLLIFNNNNIIIWIPKIFIKVLHYCGKLTFNIFLKENTIKLVTDNIYPSSKIQRFVDLYYTLEDLNNNV